MEDVREIGDICNALKLENQVCFPLYAASRAIMRKYTPILAELDLTYTQYIVMLVLWERRILTVGELGKLLKLDTGTLSPLFKTMEAKGLLRKIRQRQDERIVCVEITEIGESLKEKAANIPEKIRKCVELSDEELMNLKSLLEKIINAKEEKEK